MAPLILNIIAGKIANASKNILAFFLKIRRPVKRYSINNKTIIMNHMAKNLYVAKLIHKYRVKNNKKKVFKELVG